MVRTEARARRRGRGTPAPALKDRAAGSPSCTTRVGDLGARQQLQQMFHQICEVKLGIVGSKSTPFLSASSCKSTNNGGHVRRIFTKQLADSARSVSGLLGDFSNSPTLALRFAASRPCQNPHFGSLLRGKHAFEATRERYRNIDKVTLSATRPHTPHLHHVQAQG